MSNIEAKSAAYVGPVAANPADATGQLGVMRVATSNASASSLLPTASDNAGMVRTLQGRFLNIKNESATDGLDVAFGIGAAPTLVYGQVSTWGTGHVSAGFRLSPGETVSWLIPQGATHLAYILGAAGPSTASMYISDTPLVPVK